MAHIARYIVEASARPAAAKATAAKGEACQHCNYSNNYYGDQVCLPQGR